MFHRFASFRVRKLVLQVLTAAAVTAASLAAQASPLPLQGRDINGNPVAANGASAVFEYDPNLGITWLRDWNVNGLGDWNTQVAWAAGLTVGAYSGWALPSVTDTGSPGCDWSYAGGTDCGSNVDTSTSPLAYLWYVELGNLAYCPPGNATCTGNGTPQPGWGPTNTGPFSNVRSSGYYWSGTEYAPATSSAWFFRYSDGVQANDDKGSQMYAVAVRPGDVASAPEPATIALLSAGLGGLGLTRKRLRAPRPRLYAPVA